ncbi:MAG TPA: 1,4-alpha-glucan-branching enzyme, partial [Bacteroidales bacterium]|nr:1,4-alpha-glucan-branching enzyme [Bacteroidales bacterium]
MANKNTPNKTRMALVENDPWLEPAEKEIENRYQRYRTRLSQIEEQYGSLTKFADAYKYFGLQYDKKAKGWFYREWAPGAFDLFLFGDFNEWNRTSHPLKKIENGVWEILLDDKTYDKKFVHNSKLK